eukprot:4136726-Prymnesium_polylepis.1
MNFTRESLRFCHTPQRLSKPPKGRCYQRPNPPNDHGQHMQHANEISGEPRVTCKASTAQTNVRPAMDRCADEGVEGARGRCGTAFDHEELVSRLLINGRPGTPPKESTRAPDMCSE